MACAAACTASAAASARCRARASVLSSEACKEVDSQRIFPCRSESKASWASWPIQKHQPSIVAAFDCPFRLFILSFLLLDSSPNIQPSSPLCLRPWLPHLMACAAACTASAAASARCRARASSSEAYAHFVISSQVLEKPFTIHFSTAVSH